MVRVAPALLMTAVAWGDGTTSIAAERERAHALAARAGKKSVQAYPKLDGLAVGEVHPGNQMELEDLFGLRADIRFDDSVIWHLVPTRTRTTGTESNRGEALLACRPRARWLLAEQAQQARRGVVA